MNEYKKALIEVRNGYIAQKKEIQERKVAILEESFEKQRRYLDDKTFNLISSNNYILSILGNFIAYVLNKKQTENDLMDIADDDVDKLKELLLLEKKYDLEYGKIMQTLEFLSSISEEEFNKLIFK